MGVGWGVGVRGAIRDSDIADVAYEVATIREPIRAPHQSRIAAELRRGTGIRPNCDIATRGVGGFSETFGKSTNRDRSKLPLAV